MLSNVIDKSDVNGLSFLPDLTIDWMGEENVLEQQSKRIVNYSRTLLDEKEKKKQKKMWTSTRS